MLHRQRGVNLRAFLPNEVPAEREIKRSAAVRGQSSRDCFWRSFEKNHTFEGLVLRCLRISSSDQWNQGRRRRRKKKENMGWRILMLGWTREECLCVCVCIMFGSLFTWSFREEGEGKKGRVWAFCSSKTTVSALMSGWVKAKKKKGRKNLMYQTCSALASNFLNAATEQEKKENNSELWSVSWFLTYLLLGVKNTKTKWNTRAKSLGTI